MHNVQRIPEHGQLMHFLRETRKSAGQSAGSITGASKPCNQRTHDCRGFEFLSWRIRRNRGFTHCMSHHIFEGNWPQMRCNSVIWWVKRQWWKRGGLDNNQSRNSNRLEKKKFKNVLFSEIRSQNRTRGGDTPDKGERRLRNFFRKIFHWTRTLSRFFSDIRGGEFLPRQSSGICRACRWESEKKRRNWI